MALFCVPAIYSQLDIPVRPSGSIPCLFREHGTQSVFNLFQLKLLMQQSHFHKVAAANANSRNLSGLLFQFYPASSRLPAGGNSCTSCVLPLHILYSRYHKIKTHKKQFNKGIQVKNLVMVFFASAPFPALQTFFANIKLS